MQRKSPQAAVMLQPCEAVRFACLRWEWRIRLPPLETCALRIVAGWSSVQSDGARLAWGLSAPAPS